MERKRRQQRGFTLMELLIVIAIILIILTIAVPKYNNQVMAAHELAAIRQIGTIHQVETQYMSQFGMFATVLTQLGPPASGAAGPQAADLIGASLASGKASGYLFTLAARPTGYLISAVPEAFNSTGRRTFYSDETLVIRANNTQEPATATSPEIR
jgi:type IV pilus assembly protein PilA